MNRTNYESARRWRQSQVYGKRPDNIVEMTFVKNGKSEKICQLDNGMKSIIDLMTEKGYTYRGFRKV
jgi:hypothetical protein